MKSKLIAYKDSGRAGRPRDREFTANHYSGFKFALHKPLKSVYSKCALWVEISAEAEIYIEITMRTNISVLFLQTNIIRVFEWTNVCCSSCMDITHHLPKLLIKAVLWKILSTDWWLLCFFLCMNKSTAQRLATEGVLKRAALWQQRPNVLNFSHAENNHYTKMRNERKCV